MQYSSENAKTSLDMRKKEDLTNAVFTAERILSKSYLNDLNTAVIVNQKPVEAENPSFLNNLNNSVRFFDVTQIVLNKNENMRDKLVSVFNAVGSAGAGLLMMIHADEKKVSIKFGVKTNREDRVGEYSAILENSLRGNFPGTKIKSVRKDELRCDILSAFPSSCTVASVTDVSGERSEEESKERRFIQGIEKLIDTMQGRTYTLLLIADPVSLADLNKSRRALENLYSSLVPFSESQMTMGESETESVSNAISHGTTETVNQSITESVSHTNGTSTSISDSTTKGTNFNAGVIIPGVGGILGVGGSHSSTHSFSQSENQSDTRGKSTQTGSSSATNTNLTQSEQHGTGINRSLQIKFENHAVKEMMKRIDKTLERYDTCADVGMWNCAMYCLAENPADAQMAANVYHSIIRGKNSSLENGGVIIWSEDKAPLIVNSLKYMSHPFLEVDNNALTPATLISSAELAIQAGLPNHSVPGLPVLECAEFGRTVASYETADVGEEKNYAVNLGKIWHMNQEETLNVSLNPDSLASHTFITGSTGAGKSNTIYKMLDECRRIGVKFLVVESAKGEYKNVFGNDSAVWVYGTNPALTPLLRINPFSFPHGNADESKNIHILEHLDRLIEIFNVCWPMYAAMPAVLKEAVEKSYEDCGWNLTDSSNEYREDLYPTFADIMRNIRTVINSSEYDAENKGAYKGSLITRLKSLTNGINGMIFTTDEIPDKELFDSNVIVDLSRVGSSETKSLIMGLLVLKLQEYRMISGNINANLKHVTVLEEAHNLLKRTSTEQTQESGNLQGKSVEMLTNAIAEMRTYGEGFIIADQAPALLDMAVIRNTNTKIIMRLPDQSDRELVGKAANLNDEQIKELAKLPRGVAAVYQNEWVEAVLCKVLKANVQEKKYFYTPKNKDNCPNTNDKRLSIAKLLFNGNKIGKEFYEKDLIDLALSASSEVKIRKCLINPSEVPCFTKIAPAVKELFPTVYKEFKKEYETTSNVVSWTTCVDNSIRKFIKADIEMGILRDIRQCIITQYVYNELSNEDALKKWLSGGVK